MSECLKNNGHKKPVAVGQEYIAHYGNMSKAYDNQIDLFCDDCKKEIDRNGTIYTLGWHWYYNPRRSSINQIR